MEVEWGEVEGVEVAKEGEMEGGMEGERAVAWLEAEVVRVVRREEVGMEAIWEAVVHMVASLAHPWAE